jgi:hypothetical protein
MVLLKHKPTSDSLTLPKAIDGFIEALDGKVRAWV